VIPDKDKEEKRVDEVLYYVVEEDVICESADAAVYDRHVAAPAGAQMKSAYYRHPHPVPQNTESYTGISENGYRDPLQEPYSTFSIDVDNASYSNVRRFINLGQEVPADAVRIEEMINYFRYDYRSHPANTPSPSIPRPASAPGTTTTTCCYRAQGEDIDRSELPPSNLVFLIDVSGSMNYPNKLPLLKSAFSLLINEQRETDRVAMVVYAGAAGVVLESTPAQERNNHAGP
jgi:Ca-activated chloride channel family protein